MLGLQNLTLITHYFLVCVKPQKPVLIDGLFIWKTNNYISNLNFTFVDGAGIFGLVLKGEMLGFDRKEKVCTNNQMAINLFDRHESVAILESEFCPWWDCIRFRKTKGLITLDGLSSVGTDQPMNNTNAR